MNRFLLIVIVSLISFPLFSQEIITTSGEYQLEWLDTQSKVEVQQKAEQLATVDALERAFGKVIIQGNSTFVQNQMTGQKVETHSGFSSIANTYVKGEVVEVISKVFKEVEGEKTVNGKAEKIREISCNIKVKARELADIPVQFDASPLACLKLNCKTISFQNNDALYFYFRSPQSGFLSIFIDDNQFSQRLLPYHNMEAKYENGVPVEADKEYFFFSSEINYFGEKNDFVDDKYELATNSSKEINRIFIIFTKSELNKPVLKENLNMGMLSNEEQELKYKLPKAMKSEDFQRWLIDNRSTRDDMAVQIIDITISK